MTTVIATLSEAGVAIAGTAVVHPEVVTRVGGYDYANPLQSNRCTVCQNPTLRRLVEAYTYLHRAGGKRVVTMVKEQLPNVHLTHRMVSNHMEKHAPPEMQTVYELLRVNASRLGEDVTESEMAMLIDPMGVMEAVVAKGIGQIMGGEIPLRASDVVNAASRLDDMQRFSAEVQDVGTMMTLFSSMVLAAQKVMPPDLYMVWMAKVMDTDEAKMLMGGKRAIEAHVVDGDDDED